MEGSDRKIPAARSRTLDPGESVAIRPIRVSDADELERFYADLSADSRRLRFFAATAGLSHHQSSAFCTPDHTHREGFVAVVVDPVAGPGERIVGHLCLEPEDAQTAEIAVAVAEAYRGRGIGRRLVATGVAWARRAGVRRLTATMFAYNVPIQRLLRGLALPTRVTPVEPDQMALTIELAPTANIAA